MRLIDETPRAGIRARASPSSTRASTGGVLTEIVQPAEGPLMADVKQRISIGFQASPRSPRA